LIFFYDEFSNYPPSNETGYNQTGIFISESEILCRRKRRVYSVFYDELIGREVVISKIKNKEASPKIIRFFKKTRSNYRLFQCGLNALQFENYRLFDSENIMPIFKKYESVEEYNGEWSRIIPFMKKGDLINIYQSTNFISKLIAKIDDGSWSHSAMYMGGHIIAEVISKGLVKRKIESYKNIDTHIGIYRHINSEEADWSKLDDFHEKYVGSKYGYLKAIICGVRTYLGLTDDKYDPIDNTPNGLVYMGTHYLVDFI